MPKFNVEVSYEVTEVYEIEAKDADVARLVANVANRAPSERRTTAPKVGVVTQVSPRYEVRESRGYADFEVHDTKIRMRVALCYSKGIADTLAKQLNAEEEAK